MLILCSLYDAILPHGGTMLTGWNIERRVTVEEADWLQRKTNHLNRHNRPIFKPDNMIGSERVPHHAAGIHENTRLLRITCETIPTGRLSREISSAVTHRL